MGSKKVVWLASYPKSGNTWARFQLLNLQLGKQTSTQNLEKAIPDIHLLGDQKDVEYKENTVIKTHFKLTKDMPLAKQTMAFIYIVRHPLDVMLSNLNYAYVKNTRVFNSQEKKIIGNLYIDDFIKHKGDPMWVNNRMGSWIENVESWLSAREKIESIILRYEDMLANPAKELSRMCSLLKLDKSENEIRKAVESSTFNSMKKIEDKEIEAKKTGFFYSGNPDIGRDSAHRFMNRGQINVAKDILSIDQYDNFSNTFGPMIEKLGY